MKRVLLLCIALLYINGHVLYAKHYNKHYKKQDETKYEWYDDYDDDEDDEDENGDTTQECNLVYNSGFELGTSGWSLSRRVASLSTKEHSGEYAVRYTNGGVSQVLTYYSEVSTDTSYIFEGYYKTKYTPYSIWVGVTYYDRYWRVLDDDTLRLKKSRKYKRFSLKTTPPRGTVHVQVWGWSYASRKARTYLDDISFSAEYCGVSVNTPPVIEPLVDQTHTIGAIVNVAVTAFDDDNDILRYSAQGLPQGLRLDAQTGVISGVPNEEGTFWVTVTVSDSSGEEAQMSFSWQITALPNSAPVIAAVNDQESTEATAVHLLIKASDADNDTLTYRAQGLPEGLYIDSQTGVISGSPLVVGAYDVTVVVSDGNGAEAQTTFVWRVVAKINEACHYLQNPSFENNTSGWIINGATVLVNGGHTGEHALAITTGGLEQTSSLLANGADTYQFHGYYKTTGTMEGISVGMIFLDANKSYISSKTLYLPNTGSYEHFIVNTTASDDVKYVQGWIWAVSDANGSAQMIVDDVELSSLECYDYTVASALPPKGLQPNEVPQFVVLGFDDNTEAEGIDWVRELFADKYNRDGSEARVSFYMNTAKFHNDVDYNASALLGAVKRLSATTHEIGNHTDNHMVHLMSAAIADKNDGLNMDVQVGADASEETYFDRIKRLSKSAWEERILAATNDLVTLAEINANTIKGFRAPYLLYTGATMSILKEQNFIYDCSVEEGYSLEFDGTNFRWPYQLNEGSPGHTESWYGRGDNEERVDINTIEGLWELPNYALMVPQDSECAQYGIEPGLWNRLVANIPYLTDYKVTGLDYNLWSMGGVNKAEMLGILKYNLDLRLKGNRAPFMFGTHSQYYTKEWADDFAPNATVEEMRSAISEFVDYALSKEVVRIRPSIEIIKWCQDPKPLP